MSEKDKRFIDNYEKLLNKGYCNCNEMNCIDNNSPRRILNVVKQLENNWNELKKWLIQLQKFKGINQQGFSWGVAQEVLNKMTELERGEE